MVLPDLDAGVAALLGCAHRTVANPLRETWPSAEGDLAVGRALDLIADLNAMDDDGLGGPMLSDAADPSRVVVGAMLLAGRKMARAVVRVVAVDDDGQVHFVVLPAPVSKSLHLLAATHG